MTTADDVSSEALAKAEALAARLEAAEAGSRALSNAVLQATGDTRSYRYDPTRSVDDGLALLREMDGWRVHSISQEEHGWYTALVIKHPHRAWDWARNATYAVTPALALSAALVRAAGKQKEQADG